MGLSLLKVCLLTRKLAKNITFPNYANKAISNPLPFSKTTTSLSYLNNGYKQNASFWGLKQGTARLELSESIHLQQKQRKTLNWLPRRDWHN